MSKFLKLLRIEQWVKNLFVFTPIFFSGNVMHVDLTLKSLFAFLVFSFTASSIYILNDYTDIESDKKHPEKCKRPLASGAISKTAAKIIFVLLILSVVLLVFFGADYFHKNFTKFSIIIASYFFMNIAYTFKLKHVAIIDVSIIALGFVFRVLAEGYATEMAG